MLRAADEMSRLVIPCPCRDCVMAIQAQGLEGMLRPRPYLTWTGFQCLFTVFLLAVYSRNVEE